MNYVAEDEDRWILGSIHRWDGERIWSGFSTDLGEQSPDDWYIKVNWRLVDGGRRALPVGIEFHSSPAAHRKGDPWPEGDRPKPVTREMFKRIPIGEVIEQGRAQVLVVWDWATSEDSDAPETARVRRGLANTSDPRSPADWKYRQTAEIYLEVMADQDRGGVGRNIAKETHRRLAEDCQITASEVRVRKWIAEARKRGYIPPA